MRVERAGADNGSGRIDATQADFGNHSCRHAGNGGSGTGRAEEISSTELKLGDTVVVKAGEVIPGDGEIIKGIASIDESAITGESSPVIREAGGAPVPVIEQLKDALDAHIVRMGDAAKKSTAPLFQAGNGKPLNLKNLTKRTILPALVGTGVQWRGWHAFRRGLATVLHAAGIDDKTISTLCGHSNVAITQNVYIKSVTESQVAAMNIFGDQAKNAAEKLEAEKLTTEAAALHIAEKSLECNDLATPKELVN